MWTAPAAHRMPLTFRRTPTAQSTFTLVPSHSPGRTPTGCRPIRDAASSSCLEPTDRRRSSSTRSGCFRTRRRSRPSNQGNVVGQFRLVAATLLASVAFAAFAQTQQSARLYRSRPEILNGTWMFPDAMPAPGAFRSYDGDAAITARGLRSFAASSRRSGRC